MRKSYEGQNMETPKLDDSNQVPFNEKSKIYEEDLANQESEAVYAEFDKYNETDTENDPTKPDYSKPPILELADMQNEEGETIDFSVAQNYHELIEMITREGQIKNQTGQVLPAESVINLIYKLTYQDLNNFKKEDWTNITLRHRLRETVAKLINEYKKTDEFKALAGLDLSSAKTVSEVMELISQQEKVMDAQGDIVYPYILINHIRDGHLHLLPEPIRFKVIELNKQDHENNFEMFAIPVEAQPVNRSVLSRVGSALSKFKFWK